MIYCANNNTLYRRAADVCADLGVDRAQVSKHLAGTRKTVGSYVLARITDISPEAVKAVRAWLLYSTFKIVLDVQDEPIMYRKEGD